VRAKIDDEGVATVRAIIANPECEVPGDKWRDVIKRTSCSSYLFFSPPLPFPHVAQRATSCKFKWLVLHRDNMMGNGKTDYLTVSRCSLNRK